MINADFEEVDCGCYMLEHELGRWVIEDPREGYLPTYSKKWDLIIEHPEEPHSETLKYLGSFKTKKGAVETATSLIGQGYGYFNIKAIENIFYNEDYSRK